MIGNLLTLASAAAAVATTAVFLRAALAERARAVAIRVGARR